METHEFETVPQFTTEEANAIQVHLIKESGKDPMEWVEENSEKFRDYVTIHPELVDLYRKNPHDAEWLIKKALEEAPDKPVN